MKVRNKIKLVFRSLAQRFFVTILLLSMCIASFYMVDIVLMNYMTDAYLINKVESTFGVEPNNVCYVSCLDYDNGTIEMSDVIKEYLSNHSGVENCGYYVNSATVDLVTEDGTVIIVAEPSLVNMGNLKLSDEEKANLVNYYGEYEPALLGYNYKGIVNIGDVFTLSPYKEDSCVVVGFLDKGASWPKSQGMFSGSSNMDAYTLDDQGILITDKYKDYDIYMGAAVDVYYICKEGQAQKVKTDVIRYANEQGISISVTNQGEQIENEKVENSITSDKTFIAALLLFVLAVISISVTTAVYCVLSKKNYGVMMVCGVRASEVVQMIIAQNALIICVSAIVAWMVRQIEIFDTLFPRLEDYAVQFENIRFFVCHQSYMPLIFVVAVIVVLLISSVVPIVFMRKMSLVELIHSKG